MRIEYDPASDTLRIEFTKEPILREESHGWNFTVGYTHKGVGAVVIADAKADGHLPIENLRELLAPPAPAHHIVSFDLAGPMSLVLRFADGSAGLANFEADAQTGQTVVPLDPDLFADVRIQNGQLIWSGGFSIDSKSIHEAIKNYGRWQGRLSRP